MLLLLNTIYMDDILINMYASDSNEHIYKIELVPGLNNSKIEGHFQK